MSKKPVIFMAFANDQAKHLPLLDQEEQELDLIFSPLHQRGYLEHHSFSRVRTADVSAQLHHFQQRISIFHYSGHAGSDGLGFEGGEGSATGMARLLAQEPDLKLVFLNGCSTMAQVDGLLEARVKAVIGTRVDVADVEAQQFSVNFYKYLAGGDTLRKSFERAAADLTLAHAKYGQVQVVMRHSMLRDPNAQKDIFPWGLYCRDDADLDWKLPEQPVSSITLDIPPASDPPLYRTLTTLNYATQIPLLRKYLRRSTVAAFFIHGAPKNGHTWLGYNLLTTIQNARESRLSRPIRFGTQVTCLADYLKELRREMAGERVPKIGPIAQEVAFFTELFLKKLESQTVLLQIHDASYILDPEAFDEFVNSFWKPLAQAITTVANAHQTKYPHKLAVLLIEEKQPVNEVNPLFATTVDDQTQPGQIVWLPALSPISTAEFLTWVQADLARPDSVLADQFEDMATAADCAALFENQDIASPISLFEKISETFGYFFFNDELGRWILEPQTR